MEYPTKLYVSKTYLVVMICGSILIGVLLLGCLAIIISQGPVDPSKFEAVRAAIDNPDYIHPESKSPVDFKRISALVILAFGGILMLGCAYVFYKLLKTNPYYMEFNPQGLNLYMGLKRPYLWLNWSDVKDVKFYKKRSGKHTIKGVAIMLKDTKAYNHKGRSIVDREALVDSAYAKLGMVSTDMVFIHYMRQGKLSHEDLVELIKVEFLKYQAKPNYYKPSGQNYKPRSQRLFGRAF